MVGVIVIVIKGKQDVSSGYKKSHREETYNTRNTPVNNISKGFKGIRSFHTNCRQSNDESTRLSIPIIHHT